jgi:hypothetical protein
MYKGGQRNLSYGKTSCISNPQTIVDAYSDKWNLKRVVALAIKKYQIKRNQNYSRFVDEHQSPILTLAVGQNNKTEMGLFFIRENKNENTVVFVIKIG